MSATIKRLFIVAAWLLAGYCLFPANASAQSCPYSWPTISAVWQKAPENYYAADSFSGGIGSTCTACACEPVSVAGDQCNVYVDGALSSTCGGWIPFPFGTAPGIFEGAHTAMIQFTAKGYATSTEQSYSFSKDFYVDKTSPTVSLSEPADGVSISTADLSISGAVLDNASKVGIVNVSLGAGAPCEFSHDLFGLNVASSSIRGIYCSTWWEESESNQAMHFCDAAIGTVANYPVNYNLQDYVDFSHGQDCAFSVTLEGADNVRNSDSKTISFLVDQMPPAVYVSTWPGPVAVSTSGVAGRVVDSSDIQYVTLIVLQRDWRGVETYWDGAAWVADTITVSVEIPQSTNTINWTYPGLTDRNMISGSHYKLTVFAADKFDHVGIAEQEFDYNACNSTEEMAPIFNTAQKFEVGDAVFRKKSTMWPLGSWIGHAGVYVVGDSNYQHEQSTDVFVGNLKSSGTLLAIMGSDFRHYIVQAGGIGKTVESVSLDGFMLSEPEKYWGAKTTNEEISAQKRDQIAYNAAIQLGKDYKFFKNWAGGDDISSPVGFRCDGLVVYAYNKAEVQEMAEISQRSWLGVTPRKLYKLMADSEANYPVAQNVGIADVGDKFNLSVTPADSGSGTDLIEYYLYTKSGENIYKRLLTRDDSDSVSAQVHTSTSVCNPGGNLVTRLVDRAGNWAIYDSTRTRLDNSEGSTASAVLAEDQSPAITMADIETRNSYLASDISNVSDDLTPASDMVMLYKIDTPFESWDDNGKVSVLSQGSTDGNFFVPSGMHKMYATVMDESFNVATVEKDFRVPGIASVGSGIPMAIGDVAISFDNLANLASISVNDTNVESLPPGYSQLPRQYSKEITIDGQYSGGFFVLMNYSSYGVSPEQEPYLQMLHNGQNITVALDRTNNLIAGFATSASPFTVAVSPQLTQESSLPDVWPPSTNIGIMGNSYLDSQGRRYVSSATLIGLNAEDDRGGNINTYYTHQMSEPLFEAGLVPASLGQFTLYSSSFTLPEGVRWTGYGSADSSSNYELLKTATFYVDGTIPETQLWVATTPINSVEPVQMTAVDLLTLNATDPVSNGVFSGIEARYVIIDISPDTCQNEPSMTGPLGTCDNPIYSEPFALSVGTHTLYYTADDRVGNRAELKSAYFVVTSTQTMLPIIPSSGPIGVPFAIEGTGFGAYAAGTTVVLLGGATAPLTLWTDTKIQGTIPGALAAGQYPVSVKRGAAVLAEVSPFTVTQPALYALTPSSGAIGLPFTITGESFGNYVANYTRVLLGGATMPLTLWTDTKIQGTIPGILPVGDYDLLVERALNGGVVRTSTAAFSLRDMEAYWLAPSSGPIGMPFTITGVGFGNYSSVYTHVLIGDTTAPLTLWTDSKIQGTVPGSLVSGQYPVLVERKTSDGGVMQTSPMTFEVVTVDVASMTPVAGPIGLPFTIYGGNFGNYVANYTRVLIGGTTASLTLWTADKIQGTIPGALGPGEYPVIVERELNGGIVHSQALAFVVSTPTAYNMAPSSGPIGLPFTINGASFGNYSAAYTGVLINGATVPLTLWTDTQIKGTIPGNLAPGQYPVVVGRMTADGGTVQTDALSFEVVGVNVASMTPVAGPIGLPFTIYGAGFGNYSAGYTKVLIGGTTCPLTLWTDTKIQGTIPGSLAAGEYPVVVERSLNGGQVQSVPVAFSVVVPEAYSLSPSSGPIGLPFTIEGANFGNYVANYTKVLIGGATAPLTLWTNAKIQGTIPGSLADSGHEVVVERALNGGVVRTSTFTFTVGTPYLGGVSPSTASVIAPFTITGYNFGNYAANYTKVLINGTTTALTLWTDTKLQGKLPFLLAGTYPVQVQRYLNGGLAESATAYINVEEPVLSSMTPVSGAVGTVFNLYGSGFGPYDATIAKVFLGGTQCALSLWTDTRITGTVPSGLSYGTHTVVAMRGQAVSNGLEYYIPGGYSPSMMRPGTGPSALEFKLGEVYVYPDPAKGGKVPTFHIEVGTADSVKLKVFTVAGQLAHETTLTGSPQAVGLVYAYEYAWTGRIASGVYYYTIEAERAGKKLKAKGKFAVVR